MSLKSIDLPPEAEETPVERISNRYGIPQDEVEGLIAGKPAAKHKPHPLTMGALMDTDAQTKEMGMYEEKQSWSPVAVLGAILGVIGILSLIVLLVFIMRTPKRSEITTTTPDKSTIQTPSASTEPEVTPAPIPIAGDTAIAPEPTEEPKPTAKPQAKRSSAQPRTYLTTTNSLEAEEKLAELRAEGNRKAKINISTRNGVTTYRVR